MRWHASKEQATCSSMRLSTSQGNAISSTCPGWNLLEILMVFLMSALVTIIINHDDSTVYWLIKVSLSVALRETFLSVF